jgi:hypothetical protein
MYIDDLLYLSNAQALTLVATTSASSTYYIDMLSTGYGHNDEVYVKFLTNTAFSVTAGASVTLYIQIAADSSFATAAYAIEQRQGSGNMATAGTVIYITKLPMTIFKKDAAGVGYRYMRAHVQSTSGATGNLDIFLVKDSDMTIDKIL